MKFRVIHVNPLTANVKDSCLVVHRRSLTLVVKGLRMFYVYMLPAKSLILSEFQHFAI